MVAAEARRAVHAWDFSGLFVDCDIESYEVRRLFLFEILHEAKVNGELSNRGSEAVPSEHGLAIAAAREAKKRRLRWPLSSSGPSGDFPAEARVGFQPSPNSRSADHLPQTTAAEEVGKWSQRSVFDHWQTVGKLVLSAY